MGAGANAGSVGMGASASLTAVAGTSRYATVGEDVVLDGSASTGAASYAWNYGNGEGTATPQASPIAHVSYSTPGRYHAVLTVTDATGDTDAAEAVITVTYPATFHARGSSTLAPLSNGKFAVVSPDSNQVVIVLQKPDNTFAVDRRITTGANPRTVVEWQGAIAVACQGAGTVEIHPLEAGPMIAALSLPYGSAPYGVGDGDTSLFVSLEGLGKLAVVQIGADNKPALVRIVDAIVDARGVAPLPDGRVAVTRLRSPNARGEVAFVSPMDGASTIVPLAFDPQGASDAEIGGVPTYLSAFAVSPTGREAVVPSLIANISDGVYLDKVPLRFDQTVRAVLSRVDLVTNQEQFDERIQFDDRGFAIAAAFSKHGDFTYVAMPGNRGVEQLDLLNGTAAGTFVHSGYSPDGVALTDDDRFLLAAAYLSREVTVYDTTVNGSEPVQHLALLDSEPLAPAVLRGKQLFNDAADTRITSSGYIACAECHLDGDSDGRVWDFTQRGEGLRNTTSLLGHAGTGDGPIHWSGNFDEVQDFEGDIRSQFEGTGLMSDADFHTGTRDQPLGDKKAGISPDLDALAAYLDSLKAEPVSPFRAADGSLTPAAQRGKALFESAALGCTTCHSGPRLTDSHFVTPTLALLHDVGTLTPASGQRLGQPLTGIDTPTLHSLWTSAPYLHDGSAPTVRDVLTTHNPNGKHGKTSNLSGANLDDLVQYLLSLDGRRD
jgi:PKD repeat protein